MLWFFYSLWNRCPLPRFAKFITDVVAKRKLPNSAGVTKPRWAAERFLRFTLLLFSCIIGLSSKQILKEQSWRSSLTWWESCEYPFFCTRFLNNCNYTANILCGAFIHKHKNENYTARHKHNHEVLQSWSRISIMTMKNIILDIKVRSNHHSRLNSGCNRSVWPRGQSSHGVARER